MQKQRVDCTPEHSFKRSLIYILRLNCHVLRVSICIQPMQQFKQTF